MTLHEWKTCSKLNRWNKMKNEVGTANNCIHCHFVTNHDDRWRFPWTEHEEVALLIYNLPLYLKSVPLIWLTSLQDQTKFKIWKIQTKRRFFLPMRPHSCGHLHKCGHLCRYTILLHSSYNQIGPPPINFAFHPWFPRLGAFKPSFVWVRLKPRFFCLGAFQHHFVC